MASSKKQKKFPFWAIQVLLGLLLLTAALLQLNDDMPWLWGSMYSLSALCFFASLSPLFHWLIPTIWSAILGAGAIVQFQREALPFWNNEGCEIGSDVPGILVNFGFSLGLGIYLWTVASRDSVTKSFQQV